MFELLPEGEPYTQILLFLAVINMVLIVKKIYDYFIRKHTNEYVLKSGLNAIFFWGAICVIIGFFGYFSTFYMAIETIIKANDLSPEIWAIGNANALKLIISGILIFLFSSIAWFLLRWRYKQIITYAKF